MSAKRDADRLLALVDRIMRRLGGVDGAAEVFDQALQECLASGRTAMAVSMSMCLFDLLAVAHI